MRPAGRRRDATHPLNPNPGELHIIHERDEQWEHSKKESISSDTHLTVEDRARTHYHQQHHHPVRGEGKASEYIVIVAHPFNRHPTLNHTHSLELSVRPGHKQPVVDGSGHETHFVKPDLHEGGDRVFFLLCHCVTYRTSVQYSLP